MTTTDTTTTTRERIVSLLQDGTPRSLTEMHIACKPATFHSVEGVVRKMNRAGALIPVAGFAARPANGPTSRRYVLAQGVTA